MDSSLTVAALLTDPAFPELKAHIIRTTGLSYVTARDADVAQRVLRRLEARGCGSCREYLHHLRTPDLHQEQEALVRELTIGETYFFRFREQFEALRRRVFPELIARNEKRRRLRVWSAGCSTGPEPYSLAILLREEFGTALAGWDVEILGTDLNREFLQRARIGRYNDWALRSLSPAQRDRYFTYDDQTWTVRDFFREWVRFRQHNLVEHTFPPDSAPGSIDLILCRNVMIYFDRETVGRTVGRFAASLKEKGWLVIGHAEMAVGVECGLQVVQAGEVTLYKKVPAGEPVPAITSDQTRRTTAALPGAGAQEQPWTPYALTVPPPATPQTAPKPSPVLEPAAIPHLRELADRGEWAAAEEHGRRLVETEPLNADAQFYLALVLDSRGDREAAEHALRRAVYLQRDHALAHYHLGLLAVRKGAAGGRKALENALHAVRHLPDDAPLSGGELTAGELRRAVGAQLRRVQQP